MNNREALAQVWALKQSKFFGWETTQPWLLDSAKKAVAQLRDIEVAELLEDR